MVRAEINVGMDVVAVEVADGFVATHAAFLMITKRRGVAVATFHGTLRRLTPAQAMDDAPAAAGMLFDLGDHLILAVRPASRTENSVAPLAGMMMVL